MHRRFTLVLRYCLLFLIVAGATLQPQSSAYALTTLAIEPLTWNIVGLDSNDVNVGPNHFPVGARVCNSGMEVATNVTAAFQWDSADPYIDLRSGTLASINLGTLNAGSCADAYFEVEVTRNSNAYDHTRDYHIDVTAGNVSGTISTPTPRELYVERLISQSRNAVTDVQLDGVSVAAGGTMTLMVGQTYEIKLVGFTATQGYEQIEYFINFPNTIFQILSVSSTFTADTSASVGPSPMDVLHGDNCVWDNDPNSPTYRACLSTGKTGGSISTTYQVRILQVPGAPLVNPQPLSTLIYDFSGSSFHYNSDFGVSTRFANIINASITKSFSPKTINPGSTSTLTFTIQNPGTAGMTGVNFTDDLPAGMTLVNNSVIYSGCGAALPATVSDPLSFSNISVAGLGTCTVAVNVTASTDGTFNNTSGNLFINTSTDTGSFATDSLVVSSRPTPPASCAAPVTLASWTMPTSGQGSGGPPPPYTVKATDVSTATASAALTAAGSQSTNTAGLTTNAWGITDAWPSVAGAPGATAAPFFDFVVDTSNYGGVRITFDRDLEAPGDWGNATNSVYIYSSADGGAFSAATAISTTKGSWQTGATATAAATGSSTTRFTIHTDTRNAAKATSTVYLDNIVISGCQRPSAPTLSKSFSPTTISRGSASTLTFTFTNPNSTALSEISFSDTLPTGLVVNTPNGLSAISCSAGSVVTAPAITATAGASTISMNGLQLSANASCSFSVSVKGNTAGAYTNISQSITSTSSGPNTTATGYGTSSLTVIDPPVLAKSFTANPIFTGSTTALDFDIVNPNASTALTGVTFTDVLPAGLSVADGTFSVCGGTNNLTTNAATRTITLLSTTTIAAGAACSFSVTVTGSSAGSYTNTTSNISSTNGGTGNTASANVLVKTPAPAINLLKQVGSTATGPWTSFMSASAGSNVYYRFTVENTGDVSLSSVSVDDPTVSTTACSWTRGDGATPFTSPFTLPVADAANNHIATCVLGPITAVSGSHTNTATVSGTSGSTVTKSSSATYGTPAITIAKSATETSFTAAGDVLNYTYLVTNSGDAPVLGPVTVTDDRTTVTCPAVTTVGDNDAWLDEDESLTCTAIYTVQAADGTAGFVTNTASASVGGITSNTDSETVNQARPDLTITKTNNTSGAGTAGVNFVWTIEVTNGGTANAVFSTGETILSDPLPVGANYSPLILIGGGIFLGPIDCGITLGVLTCTADGGPVSIPSGASFAIDLIVTPTGAGSLTNTATVDPNGNITEGDETNNTGSDTVNVTAVTDLSLDKQVSNTTPNVGSTVTFTLVLSNAGPSTATNIAVTDVVPSGYTYVPASIAGGTSQNDASPAGTGLSWIISSLASGASTNLTYQATVLGTGAYDNYAEITSQTETDSDSTAGNGQQTPDEDDDDTQAVTPVSIQPPVIAKQFSPNPVAINVVSTLTFTITNPNAGLALNGIAFTDNLPAGMQVAATPNATTSGCGSPTFAPAAGNTALTFSGGTIAASGTCTVSVNVISTTAGTKTNTTGNVSSTNGGTGNTATATLGVVSALKTVIATSEDSSSELNAPRLVLIGEVVRYHLAVELPEGTTTNLQFVDSIVANMAYLNDGSTRVAFVCNSGASCASSSVAGIGTNPVVAGNVNNVTPTFVLPSASISGGTGNPYNDGADPTFSLGNVTNNDIDSDAEYVVIEFNVLVRNTTGNQDTNTRGNDFTVNVNGSAVVSSVDNANSRVTVTEPVISSITKSITATPTDAGDAITYQLQITNTGTAPAFDIVVTDKLNAVLTTPITISGSTTGGSCGSTASTVSGSFLGTNVTATVTCLAVGGTATVNITATVSNTALAGYTFTNAANLTYTSLPGASGTAVNPTGSTTPGTSGSASGERNGTGGTNNYTAVSNTVTTTLASPALAKTIDPAGTSYAIGTTIPYEITVTLPEGVTGGPIANLVETIPTGLSYVAGSLTVTPQAAVTIGAPGPYTDANAGFFNLTGQTMTLSFGSFTSTASAAATNRTVTAAFLARVDNVVGNQSGTTFNNSVDFVRTNPNGVGTVALTAADASASVVEPDLAVTKTPSTTTPAFNSTLTYTLTIEHTGASNSVAYLLLIRDTLPAGLTGLTNVNISSTAPAGCATGVDNTSTASVLNVSINSISLGCAVTITYDATASGAVGSTQTNSVAVAWASTPNLAGGDRTGADGPGGALNDYAAVVSESVTVSGPDFRTTKTDGSPTYIPGAPITYTITVDNDGSAEANGIVTDTFSTSLTNVTWTCAGTGNATCGTSGTGDINDAVSIPAGESVTYTINATVAAAATGDLVNTATSTLSSGTDPTPGNNSSTDTDTSGNLTPDAVADTNVATENGPAVNGNVLTNENALGNMPTTVTAVLDDDGEALTIGVPFTTDAGGSLTLNADGTYTYTPPATLPEGAVLTEVFTYTITDNDGDTDAATLTITVDRLPQANPDTNTAVEGGGNATGNVIANDDEGNVNATVSAANQDGNPITIGVPFTTAAGGTLTLNGDGTYTYTPPATLPEGGSLTEVFGYTITDADGDTSSSTLTITVDRLPAANPDTNTATEGGADATGNVITNDDEGNPSATVTAAEDDDGDSLTIGVPFTTDAGGILTLNSDGSYAYTPPALGSVPPGGLTEVFAYTITDADGDTSTSTLTITVDDNDRLPDAVADTNTAIENGPVVNGNVLTNENSLGDTPTTVTSVVDDDGDALTIGTPFTTDGGGTLTINADGTYTYTSPVVNLVPPGGLVEVFTYTITDVDGDPSTTTLTITVDDSDQLPVATDNSYTINDGETATGNVMTDGTPDTLGDPPTTVTSFDATSVNGGTVTMAPDGSFSYDPNGYVGTDTFTYTITDDDGDTSTATVTITVHQSLIGAAKRVVSTTEVSPGTYDVTYDLYVENFGTTALNNIQVTDDLSATFPAPTTFTIRSLSSGDFTVNPGYNGSTATDLLDGSDGLAVGANGNITLVVRVVPASSGPFNNIATASGQCPTCNEPVTDDSQDGSDPDPDNDEDPTNDNDPTPLTFGPNLFDPPFGLKVVDATGLPVLQWTMVWINDSNIVAIDAEVSDPISAGTAYAGGLTCVVSGVTTTNLCTYEAPSGSYPRGRVVWNGNLGPDLGATNAATAVNEITITFNVNVDTGVTSVQNTATIDADLNGDNDITDPGEQIVASASSSWTATPTSSGNGTLPSTGFAPNVVTDMSNVPHQAYTATGDVTVEIPNLNVKIPVVGIPKKDGTWNVSWLGNQAGWLEGSAFPSWNGNSVLTSHVYLSNGLPGPFVNLGTLKYGDKIVIHAYGQIYTFEVRENKIVEPNDLSVMKHEEKSWLTLVTCKEYDPKTNTYRKRVVVRAVLVSVTR